MWRSFGIIARIVDSYGRIFLLSELPWRKNCFIKIFIAFHIDLIQELPDFCLRIVFELRKLVVFYHFQILHVYRPCHARDFLNVPRDLYYCAEITVLNHLNDGCLADKGRSVFEYDYFRLFDQGPQNCNFLIELTVSLDVTKTNWTVQAHFVKVFQVLV